MGSKILNQEEMIHLFGGQVTLTEIIRSLELEFQKANEVVCQIRVNGVPLSEADELKFGATLVQDLLSVEVATKAPRDILREVVANWVIEIPRMIASNDQLSQELRFKGVEGNLKRLIDLVDGCQLLIDSIISMQSLFETLKTMKSENWKSAQKLAASAIGEALMAFQKKDFNLMADVLEYDLGHALQIWLDLLSLIQAEVIETTQVTDATEFAAKAVLTSNQLEMNTMQTTNPTASTKRGETSDNDECEESNSATHTSNQKFPLGTA